MEIRQGPQTSMSNRHLQALTNHGRKTSPSTALGGEGEERIAVSSTHITGHLSRRHTGLCEMASLVIAHRGLAWLIIIIPRAGKQNIPPTIAFLPATQLLTPKSCQCSFRKSMPLHALSHPEHM